jgi:hypothetical protein
MGMVPACSLPRVAAHPGCRPPPLGLPLVPTIVILAEMVSWCGDPPSYSQQAGNTAEDL